MYATDSFKALARRTGMTISQIREIASDLGLEANYSPSRRTWFLAENASTVTLFNSHLSSL